MGSVAGVLSVALSYHPSPGGGLSFCFSYVKLFVSPGNVARQAPLSMEFSRQEYWSGLPFPPPGDLPDPRIRAASPVSPVLQVDSLPLSHLGKPNKY